MIWIGPKQNRRQSRTTVSNFEIHLRSCSSVALLDFTATQIPQVEKTTRSTGTINPTKKRTTLAQAMLSDIVKKMSKHTGNFFFSWYESFHVMVEALKHTTSTQMPILTAVAVPTFLRDVYFIG